MKRGLVASQAVGYVVGILIVLSIFIYGYSITGDVQQDIKNVDDVRLQQSLERDVYAVQQDYGSVIRKSYKVAAEYVCFVDITKKDLITFGANVHPLIEDSVRSGASDNVFMVSSEQFDSFSITPFSIDQFPHYICVDAADGKLDVEFSGGGESAGMSNSELITDNMLLSPDLGATLELSDEDTTQLSDLSIEAMDASTVGVTDAASFVYRFEPSGTVINPPALLRLAYDSAVFGECPVANDVVFYHYDNNDQLISQQSAISVDCDAHIATFSLSSFSYGYIANPSGTVGQQGSVQILKITHPVDASAFSSNATAVEGTCAHNQGPVQITSGFASTTANCVDGKFATTFYLPVAPGTISIEAEQTIVDRVSITIPDTGVCGDGVCDASENCPQDCGATLNPVPSPPPSTSPRVYPSEQDRINEWEFTEQIGGDVWEVSWDGSGSPANNNMPYHMWWDNPHDDDLDAKPDERGACRFRFDDPVPGQMTIDRINTPDGAACPFSAQGFGGRVFTANFMRRDEYMDGVSETGATFEMDMQILQRSNAVQYEATRFVFIGTHGSFGVHFSPNCIKVGPSRSTSSIADRLSCVSSGDVTAAAVDTTSMRTYRIVLNKAPRHYDVDVYVDGQFLVSGKGNGNSFNRLYPPGAMFTQGDIEYEFPYILIGDNIGPDRSVTARNEDYSPAFTVDGVRYTRGVYPPGSRVDRVPPVGQSSRARTPPPLPTTGPITTPGLEFDSPLTESSVKWYKRTILDDATSTYTVGEYDESTETFTPTNSPDPAKGMLMIDGAEHGGYEYHHLPGITGNGEWHLETRLKVLPQSTDSAFAVSMWDWIGFVVLAFSPDKVDLRFGGKFEGVSEPVPIDATEFHTYRLVRPQNSQYVYLYIDNNPTPAIADFKMSAVQMNGIRSTEYRNYISRLWFGWVNHVFPDKWELDPGTGEYHGAFDNYAQHVVVDYIRWSDGSDIGATPAPQPTPTPSPSPTPSPQPDPQPPSAPPGTVGAYCTAHSQCFSGFCSTNFCQDTSASPPTGRQSGALCTAHNQCLSGLCSTNICS